MVQANNKILVAQNFTNSQNQRKLKILSDFRLEISLILPHTTLACTVNN